MNYYIIMHCRILKMQHTQTHFAQQQYTHVCVCLSVNRSFRFTASTNRTHRKSLENCSAGASDVPELAAGTTANDVATTLLLQRVALQRAEDCSCEWQQCCCNRFE